MADERQDKSYWQRALDLARKVNRVRDPEYMQGNMYDVLVSRGMDPTAAAEKSYDAMRGVQKNLARNEIIAQGMAYMHPVTMPAMIASQLNEAANAETPEEAAMLGATAFVPSGGRASKAAEPMVQAEREMTPAFGYADGGEVRQAYGNGSLVRSLLSGEQSFLTKLAEEALKRRGAQTAMRVERAADEIPNLERQYTPDALREALLSNEGLVMTMKPGDFQKYAQKLPPQTGTMPLAEGELPNKYSARDEYLRYLSQFPVTGGGGFKDTPYLVYGTGYGESPRFASIVGHEGRHRMLTLEGLDEPSTLARLIPSPTLKQQIKDQLQEKFPYRNPYDDERLITQFKSKVYKKPQVIPEKRTLDDFNLIDLPEPYAEGGAAERALDIAKQRHGYQDGGFPILPDGSSGYQTEAPPADPNATSIFDNPTVANYFAPDNMAAGLAGSLVGGMIGGPVGGLLGGFAGRGIYSSMKDDEGRADPISSSTSYDNSGAGKGSTQSSTTAAPAQAATPVDTSWVGDLSGSKESFASPDVSPTAFAEGKSATFDFSAPSIGPYGNLEGAKSAFAQQQVQTDEEAAAQAQNAAANEDQGGGLVGGGLFGGATVGNTDTSSTDTSGNVGNDDSGGGGYSGNYGGGWGDDSDNQGGWGDGESGGADSGGDSGGESGGEGGGEGGGGGGDGEKRGGFIYPVRHHTDWEESLDYEKHGGNLTHMSPDQYLDKVEPLKMDDEDKDIIQHFKEQIEKKTKLDPLAIGRNGKANGRHRAHAAKELGIKKIPVVTWQGKERGGTVVKRAIMLVSKKA